MEVDTSSATTWKVVNIIKEECLKIGHYAVEEALICCTMKMIYDNPKNGFDTEVPMDRHAVRRLIGEKNHYFKWRAFLLLLMRLSQAEQTPKVFDNFYCRSRYSQDNARLSTRDGDNENASAF